MRHGIPGTETAVQETKPQKALIDNCISGWINVENWVTAAINCFLEITKSE